MEFIECEYEEVGKVVVIIEVGGEVFWNVFFEIIMEYGCINSVDFCFNVVIFCIGKGFVKLMLMMKEDLIRLVLVKCLYF